MFNGYFVSVFDCNLGPHAIILDIPHKTLSYNYNNINLYSIFIFISIFI